MEKNLFKLQITGSKERKSLSGALKCSQVTSIDFWKEVKKIIKDKIDPAWIVSKADEKQLNRFSRKGENLGKREIWSAWLVETIIRKYAQTL